MADTAMKSSFGDALRVYGSLGAFARSSLLLIWIALILALWFLNPIKALPNPAEVIAAFGKLWNHENSSQGLAYNTYVTLKLNVVGLLYSSLISLVVAYLSVIPVFYPFNRMVQWLRYIPIIGFN